MVASSFSTAPVLSQCRSFADLFAPFRAPLPRVLVGDRSWSRVLSLSRGLPLAVADHEFGFECPLGTPDPDADFGFAIAPRGVLASRLSSCSPSLPFGLPRVLVRYFVDVPAGVPVLGPMLLEYDVRHGGGLSGIFLTSVRAVSFECPLQTLAVFALLVPFPGAPQRDGFSDVFFGLRRAGARVPSAGFFAGRSFPTCRIDATVDSFDGVPSALHASRWPGDAHQISEFFASLPMTFQYWVTVDVGLCGDVLPRLGIELHPPQVGGGWTVATAQLWSPVLQALVDRGLCSPSKATALLRCHGPIGLPTPYGVLRVNGGLNHLKFVFASGSVSVKAYPGFNFGDPFSAS